MHLQHEHLEERDGHHHDGSGNGGVATAVSIVYWTATPDFSGPVMGYTTIGVGGSPQQQSPTAQAPMPTTNVASQPSSPDSAASPTFDSSAAVQTSDSHHTSPAAATSNSLLSTIPTSTDSSAAFSTAFNQSPTDSFASSSSTSSPVSSSSSGGGLSGGAQAGIAIAVIAIVGLVAGLAFFAYRRKKQSEEGQQHIEEEKQNPFGDSAAAPAPMSHIPPPNFTSNSHIPSQSFFDGPTMAGALGGGAAAAAVAGSGSANASRSNFHPEKPVNPFSEAAQNASQASLTQSIPIGADDNTMPPGTSDTEKAAFGATIAGATLATRPSQPPSMDNGPPKPLPPFAAGAGVPGSPAASTFSVNSISSAAMAGAAGAAAGPNGQPPVHRVQLEFKGSMQDEIDVRTGDLVAIVHEYDDGWVLARRLDKSKQGVCPRSCLSPRPLQPRNRGPPPPGVRGPPPPRTASPAPSARGPLPGRTASPAPSNRGPPPGRTASPAPGSRSASPALNPNMNNWPAKPINASTITPNMNQWPMKPTNAPTGPPGMMPPRSMSPGPYGGGPPQAGQRPYGPVKRRSNSMGNIPQPRPNVPEYPGAGHMGGRVTSNSEDLELPIQSPGSPVARKPVPGMAS